MPTAADRLIQQAIAQVLQGIRDPAFSEPGFGFRPGRSAHDPSRRAKTYVQDGYRYIVDIDLKKFIDQVNHDNLMSRLATRVRDKRVLKLIRRSSHRWCDDRRSGLTHRQGDAPRRTAFVSAF